MRNNMIPNTDNSFMDIDCAYKAGYMKGHADGIATEKALNISDKINREWDAKFHESPTPANDRNKPSPTNQVVQKSGHNPPAPKPAPQNVLIAEGSQRVLPKK